MKILPFLVLFFSVQLTWAQTDVVPIVDDLCAWITQDLDAGKQPADQWAMYMDSIRVVHDELLAEALEEIETQNPGWSVMFNDFFLQQLRIHCPNARPALNRFKSEASSWPHPEDRALGSALSHFMTAMEDGEEPSSIRRFLSDSLSRTLADEVLLRMQARIQAGMHRSFVSGTITHLDGTWFTQTYTDIWTSEDHFVMLAVFTNHHDERIDHLVVSDLSQHRDLEYEADEMGRPSLPPPPPPPPPPPSKKE